MDQKGFMRGFVLVLGFTYVLAFVSSVPVTRSSKSAEEKPSSVQSFFTQGTTNISENSEKEMIGFKEVERRMEIESNDYPGTGANNRHEPPKPPRAG